MDPDTIRDYLIRADMNDGQAEALSRVFAEMATKADILRLEERMQSDILRLEERMQAEFTIVRGEMKTDLALMRADLIWQIIAVVGFFATASTLLNIFMG